MFQFIKSIHTNIIYNIKKYEIYVYMYIIHFFYNLNVNSKITIIMI